MGSSATLFHAIRHEIVGHRVTSARIDHGPRRRWTRGRPRRRGATLMLDGTDQIEMRCTMRRPPPCTDHASGDTRRRPPEVIRDQQPLLRLAYGACEPSVPRPRSAEPAVVVLAARGDCTGIGRAAPSEGAVSTDAIVVAHGVIVRGVETRSMGRRRDDGPLDGIDMLVPNWSS